MYKQTVHIAAVCLGPASCNPCDFSPGDPGESGLHCVSMTPLDGIPYIPASSYPPVLCGQVPWPWLFAALPGLTLTGPQFLASGYLHLSQFTELSPRMCVVEGG